jgi:integrase
VAKKYPNLWKRGRMWYSNITVDGVYVRRPLDTDLSVARRKLHGLLDSGADSPQKRLWSNFKARYKGYLAPLPKSTRMAHARALAHIETHKIPTYVDDFTPGDLQDLYTGWKQTRPKHVRIKDVKSIKAIMRKAEAWGVARQKDWKSVKVERTARGRVLHYSMNHLRLIFKSMKGRNLTLAYLGARAGLRPAEAYYIEWRDFDAKKRTLRVDSKPEYGWNVKDYEKRIVPIPKDLYSYLLKLKRHGNFIVSDKDGKRPSLEVVSALFTRNLRALGLPGTTYTLRHTFGTMIGERERLEVVRDLLGHESTKTSEIYVHHPPTAGEIAVRKLPDIL